jgi:hypothetical protein
MRLTYLCAVIALPGSSPGRAMTLTRPPISRLHPLDLPAYPGALPKALREDFFAIALPEPVIFISYSHKEARVNLATARELIERCGYHRRDEELAELEAVRDGHRCFADLPPRV